MTQLTHFEKLSFCSEGNLYAALKKLRQVKMNFFAFILACVSFGVCIYVQYFFTREDQKF